MKTEDIISRIVAEGARKPLPSPMKQMALWLGGTVLYLGGVSAYHGLRSDVSEKLAQAFFLLEAGVLVVLAMVSALSALCLSRPDAHQMPWIRFVPVVLLCLWGVIACLGAQDMTYQSLTDSLVSGRLDCPLHILIFSLPPGIGMFFFLKMGAPTYFYSAGLTASLSVTAFAYLCLRLIEPNDTIAHLLIWHALPVFGLCIVGVLIARVVLKWR